jgi:hypothetical protein
LSRRGFTVLVVLFIFALCTVTPHGRSSDDRPSPQFRHRMAYDPVNERVLLFGGAIWEDRYTFFDDLWVLDTAEGDWREILQEAPLPEEQPEEPDQRGIPVFPPASIILGIALFTLILAYERR